MALLSHIAQNTMDLYYNEFKSDDDFFKLYHFMFVAGAVYATALQQEWQQSYRRSLQNPDGAVGEASISPDWFISEKVEVKKGERGQYVAQMSHPVFSFLFDKHSTGIQDVYPVTGGCRDFIRISINELYKLKQAPKMGKVLWVPIGNKILFENVKCGLKEVEVFYLPALSDPMTPAAMSDVVSDAFVATIATQTFKVFSDARNGTVIDMSTDGNPNKVVQSEINNHFRKD